MSWRLRNISGATLIGLGVLVSGCVIAPKEAKVEQKKVEDAGKPYATTRAVRTIADLPARPDWRDVLTRAFQANGDLEAAYYQWAIAVSKIDQVGTWPAQPLELGFDYMFSGGGIKTFDKTTFSAKLMDATPLPNKTYQDAKVAWREAEAAGERFRGAKFELQAKVLSAWADYGLMAERIRIRQQNIQLLNLVANTAGARVRAGGAQQDLLRAQVELRTALNEMETLRAELAQQRATLNAILVRSPDAPLEPPEAMPVPRAVPDDAALLAMGVANNAELAALDKDKLAREAAIVRARLEYQPQFNLTAAFTGSVSQAVGGSVVLPTRLPAIRAMVSEARADLRRVEAQADQQHADRASRFVATLVALRDAERRANVFQTDILPLATRSLDLTRQGYSSGTVTYIDVITSQQALLDVRLMIADAQATRDRMLADLEMLAGADVESLSRIPTSRPTTSPTTSTATETHP